MADIALSAGLTPDDSALQGASKLFFYLWESAWQHGVGTAGGDADALHDMRVNLRRLRTAMQNFEGSKTTPMLSKRLRGEIREHRSEMGLLGDRLGAVRDFDVLEKYVTDYAKETLEVEMDELPGLSQLLLALQNERADAFGPMVKRLSRAQRSGDLHEEFGRWALGLPAAQIPSLSLSEVAHTLLASRLDEVLEHASSLEPGADPEAHHELRKSLRRVRYTLETLSVCFAKPVKPFVKKLVEMQDLLGEMQDRTVLSETTARIFGHKESDDVWAFNEHGRVRQDQLLAEVRIEWQKAEDKNLWNKLRVL